jgi:glyoxylase-like metal-dependent hydrolase (beta-lactamase superfamily II)
MMHFGDLEIDLISDGMVRVDAGGPFGLVPRPLYQSYLAPDSNNTVPMSLLSMLIRSRGKTILIDTGLGEKSDAEASHRWGLSRENGGLLAGLKARGFSPQDIDIVINTHLHSDHCGGNTRFEGKTLVATFPRAEYWVQRIEWADACHPDARTRGTYLSKNFNPLWEAGRLRLLHGDTQATDEVHCIVTPGHTRGHQSVLLRTEGWSGMFVGDMATYAVNMARSGWLTSYDVLPLENVTTKERWQRWSLERDAWLFFEHDPSIPVAKLEERDGRYEVVAIAEAQSLIDGLPRLQPPGE